MTQQPIQFNYGTQGLQLNNWNLDQISSLQNQDPLGVEAGRQRMMQEANPIMLNNQNPSPDPVVQSQLSSSTENTFGTPNWNWINFSNTIQSGLSYASNTFGNSRQNAVLDYNRNHLSPLNYLPRTSNTSLQDKYGTPSFEDGGSVEEDDLDDFIFGEDKSLQAPSDNQPEVRSKKQIRAEQMAKDEALRQVDDQQASDFYNTLSFSNLDEDIKNPFGDSRQQPTPAGFEGIFANEGAATGQATNLNSSAIGRGQMIQSTRYAMYSKLGLTDKKEADERFKSDPKFEMEVLNAYKDELDSKIPSNITGTERQFRIAKGWYTGDVNAPDNVVPHPEVGNKLTAGEYATRALKKFQQGGLTQYPDGGAITVTDPNDPRYKAYLDSFAAHQKSVRLIDKIRHQSGAMPNLDWVVIGPHNAFAKPLTAKESHDLYLKNQKEGTTDLNGDINDFQTERGRYKNWPSAKYIGFNHPDDARDKNNKIYPAFDYYDAPKQEYILKGKPVVKPEPLSPPRPKDHLTPLDSVNFDMIGTPPLGNPIQWDNIINSGVFPIYNNTTNQLQGTWDKDKDGTIQYYPSQGQDNSIPNGLPSTTNVNPYPSTSIENVRFMKDGGSLGDPTYDALSKVLLNRNQNLNFVDRAMNPQQYPIINNSDGTYSTHRMAWDGNNDGTASVYPTIIQDPNTGQLQQLNSDQAWNYAHDNNQMINVPSYRLADYFSNTGYKDNSNLLQNDQMQTGGIFYRQNKEYDLTPEQIEHLKAQGYGIEIL